MDMAHFLKQQAAESITRYSEKRRNQNEIRP